MVSNKKTSKIKEIFELPFVWTVFVKILYVVSIISSHIITELSVILPTCLAFSQLHIARFQVQPFSHTLFIFYTDTDTCYSTLDLSFTFSTIKLTFALSWYMFY